MLHLRQIQCKIMLDLRQIQCKIMLDLRQIQCKYVRSTLNSTQSHVGLALKRRFYLSSMHTAPNLHNFAFF